jgi:hypothetical protein
LAAEYFGKHPFQYGIGKLTNFDHIRERETLADISHGNLRPMLEGLLWALCRGNDDSILGRIYKRMVYGVS